MRRVECFRDCRAKWTQNPDDCRCAERDDALREDAMDMLAEMTRDNDE